MAGLSHKQLTSICLGSLLSNKVPSWGTANQPDRYISPHYSLMFLIAKTSQKVLCPLSPSCPPSHIAYELSHAGLPGFCFAES